MCFGKILQKLKLKPKFQRVKSLRSGDVNWAASVVWADISGLHNWWLYVWLNTAKDQLLGLKAFLQDGERGPSRHTWSGLRFWKKRHSSGCHGKGWMTSFGLGSQPRPPLSFPPFFHLHSLPQLLSSSQLKPLLTPASPPVPLLSSLLITPLISCPFS